MAITRLPTTALSGTSLPSTITSASGLSLGKIGQVVTTTLAGTQSSTSRATTDSFSDSNLTATLTPTSTSSKIFVSCQVNTGATNFADGSHIGRFTQAISGGSTTVVNVGDTAGNRIETSSGRGSESQGSNTLLNTHFSFVLSPSTTSAVTITYQFACRGTGSSTAYINRSGDDGDNIEQQRTASHITIMEILP